jgi:putative transposase
LILRPSVILIQRANVSLVDPDAIQQAALVQWVAWGYVYNLGLEQWCEFGRGRCITYVSQARELTTLRDEVDWFKAAPVHALQNALRAVEDAFQRFFADLCAFPKPRKKFLNDSFTRPAEDVTFRRLTKNYDAIGLPKISRVKVQGLPSTRRPVDVDPFRYKAKRTSARRGKRKSPTL